MLEWKIERYDGTTHTMYVGPAKAAHAIKKLALSWERREWYIILWTGEPGYETTIYVSKKMEKSL